jgi:hypothetical protein
MPHQDAVIGVSVAISAQAGEASCYCLRSLDHPLDQLAAEAQSMTSSNQTVRNIPVENLSFNPFLEIPTWEKSREIMQDIGDAHKWTLQMGALLKHSPQQCHAVANILQKGCDYCRSNTEEDEIYCYLYPGFSPAVYWIYEHEELVEQTKLYELLFQMSQELDVNLLPLIEAQCCSRCMLDDVSRHINMDHQKKFHVQLAEFRASGGQMPDRHEWNFEEMLKGSGLEQKLQPKKTMFARKLFGAVRASHANNTPQ